MSSHAPDPRGQPRSREAFDGPHEGAEPDAHEPVAGAASSRSALLRQRGLRVTASRLAVLELVEGSEEPLAHHDVCDRLGESPWNRSTLYRNLIDLTEVGILVKTEIGGVMRFQRAGKQNACAEHPHFVCTDCGTVTHLDNVVVRVDRLDGSASPAAVAAGRIEVQLRGRCDTCA